MQLQLASQAKQTHFSTCCMLLFPTSGTLQPRAARHLHAVKSSFSANKRGQTEGRNQNQLFDVHAAGPLPGKEAPLCSRAANTAFRLSYLTSAPPCLPQSR